VLVSGCLLKEKTKYSDYEGPEDNNDDSNKENREVALIMYIDSSILRFSLDSIINYSSMLLKNVLQCSPQILVDDYATTKI